MYKQTPVKNGSSRSRSRNNR